MQLADSTYLIDPLHGPAPLGVGARLHVRPEGLQAQRVRALGDRLSQAVQGAQALGVVHAGDRVVEGEVEEDSGPGRGHVGGRGRQIGEDRRGWGFIARACACLCDSIGRQQTIRSPDFVWTLSGPRARRFLQKKNITCEQDPFGTFRQR